MGVFAMPSLGADMEDGTLVEWLVSPGDSVSRGDTVAVVETQKGAIEIEVFQEGVVRELTAEIGAKLPVGAPMAVILGEGEGVDVEAPPPKETPEKAVRPQPTAAKAVAKPVALAETTDGVRPMGSGVRASPAARQRANELGLSLDGISGTGPEGVIVLGDIDRAASTSGAAAPSQPRMPAAERPSQAPRTNMDQMRKAIAAAMARSKQTIPHFYLAHTIDLQPATEFLASYNADRAPKDRVLMGALFVRATARAAQAVPKMNGHFAEDGFQPSAAINPGVAIALRGGGLVAPALFDAPSMDLDATMAGMRDLVARARAGRLKGSEMTKGTITISSLGDAAVEAMTGVIFPPQVALVGIGAPQARPWVVDGDVVPREVVTITVSADHRVADGRQAARFLAAIDTALQYPESL